MQVLNSMAAFIALPSILQRILQVSSEGWGSKYRLLSVILPMSEAEVQITYVLALPTFLTDLESVLHGVTP